MFGVRFATEEGCATTSSSECSCPTAARPAPRGFFPSLFSPIRRTPSKDVALDDNCWGALEGEATPRHRQLRRSAPVLPLAFYRFEQDELSDDKSNSGYTPPTEAAIHMSQGTHTRTNNSAYTNGLMESFTNVSSNWRTEWGPGQRLLRYNPVRKVMSIPPIDSYVMLCCWLVEPCVDGVVVDTSLTDIQSRCIETARWLFGSVENAASYCGSAQR